MEEVRAFRSRGLDPDLPAMKALGVPQLIAHLDGTLDLAEAIEISKRESRRYAKRQMTWFRNQQAGWDRVTALHKDGARTQLAALLG